ncbi:hypothetical protein [Bacillus nakamurai]|uniref:hypothetical protein n=1 Tax=Bacillus nakamurai TaxID=1793963 RepID=UPI0020C3AF5F|nr:hypothetical protein [Bacillus nakamurai]MCP6682289.1 hypothetical protein [Bacillus nakamurai]
MVKVKSYEVNGNFPIMKEFIDLTIEEGSLTGTHLLVRKTIAEMGGKLKKIVHQRGATDIKYKTYFFAENLNMLIKGYLGTGSDNSEARAFKKLLEDFMDHDCAKQLTLQEGSKTRHIEIDFLDEKWGVEKVEFN